MVQCTLLILILAVICGLIWCVCTHETLCNSTCHSADPPPHLYTHIITIRPPNAPYPFYSHIHPIPNPWQPRICSPSLSLFHEDYINGTLQHVYFWDQFFFFTHHNFLKVYPCFVLCINHSYFFITIIPRYGCTTVCSTTKEHLGTFWFLVIVNKAIDAMHKFSSLWDICLRVQVLFFF